MLGVCFIHGMNIYITAVSNLYNDLALYKWTFMESQNWIHPIMYRWIEICKSLAFLNLMFKPNY